MKMADASVLAAILLREDDWMDWATALWEGEVKTSPLSIFEAGLAVAKLQGCSKEEGAQRVEQLIKAAGANVVAHEAIDGISAARAYDAFGKGSGSKAKLNMGDCFAYAMAKRLGATLLYKGDDFAHTDLA